tara:strand:- start:154 stop:1200 length:1047 start_codon:yes stop_codon:yes gene_type:complete
MILPLETFRGIFALIIVLHHLKIDTFVQKSNLIINGGLVVDFFFVLSGFVISLNYIEKINSKIDLINFQKKRFLRLYPLHLLTLLVFVFIELIKIIVENYTNLQTTYAPFTGFNNFYSLFANFFLLHGWYGWSFNLPSWSISTEFYTYFIFGLVVLNTRYKLSIFILLILLSLLLFTLNNIGFENLDNFIYPIRCIYSFFLGSIFFLIYKKLKKNISQFYSLIMIVLCILLIHFSDYLILNNKYIFAPLLFGLTILLISSLKNNSILYRILSNRYTVYLGTISYGVYMIHFGLVWFFRQFCRFILNIPENENYLVFNSLFGEISTIIFVLLVIYLSHLSFKYFENKFR